jgi:YfiR/HmsC-like
MTMWHRSTPFPGLARIAGAAALLGLVLSASASVPTRAQEDSATLADATTGAATPEQPSREYLLKTAFVFNFARYTTWPPPSPDGPFNLCILGQDDFGAAAQYLDGQHLRERNIDVRFHQVDDDLRGCQLVYVTQPLAGQLDSLLPRLHAERMLTVSDIPDFAARGGILGLKIVDNRIRFEANPVAAKRAGLRLSAQLLRLADVVAEHVLKGSPG